MRALMVEATPCYKKKIPEKKNGCLRPSSTQYKTTNFHRCLDRTLSYTLHEEL